MSEILVHFQSRLEGVALRGPRFANGAGKAGPETLE